MSTSLRALIVEDSLDDTALILRALRRGGYEVVSERVETAEDMNAALDRAEWDVILSDYTMPRFNAPAALDVLKNQQLDIPFILVSGTIGEETAVKAMKAGAQDFLTKGNLARLVPALERELREAQVRRQRRQAEEELRKSEERFRQIAETIDEVFWIADPDITRMIYVSPGYERAWGRSAESLYENPRSFLESIHSDDREGVLADLESKETGQPFDHEYRLVRPDGSVRWIWDRGYPVRTEAGQVSRFVGVAVDITARKLAEAEKARLVTAIEQSAEGVVITNTAGDIEYVNPAYTHITGHSREEVLGHNPRILKSGKHDRLFYERLWTTILNGEAWHGELSNRRKDGTLYTEELNITPARNTNGEITHFISTKRDITERKRLEEQFRQAQKMEAVGRLAGGVAHDFNNLLTVINGYAEIMLDGLGSSDRAYIPLEEIRKAGVQAASLTHQLLAFSRQQVLAPQVLDLNPLVADMEKMLRRLLGEDVDLVMVQDPGLGQVKADPGQIRQIVANLAVNARDAMPQGGKLTIETSNAEFDAAYEQKHPIGSPGRYVMLAVSDTGTGMDAETPARIFEPFFTTKEEGKGTGLGLAMVYGTVRQSGGFIWVYSEPGRGTAIKIYLPRVEEVAESVEHSEAHGQSTTGKETILLVEDDEAVRALAKRILQDLGYKVLESISAEDALQIGERHQEPIDLLLTDVVMPRMSGRKVAEHLSRLRPGLKVLFMSGYTNNAIVHHGVLEANTVLLQKPFTPSSLARKVREVLDTRLGEKS